MNKQKETAPSAVQVRALRDEIRDKHPAFPTLLAYIEREHLRAELADQLLADWVLARLPNGEWLLERPYRPGHHGQSCYCRTLADVEAVLTYLLEG